MHCSSRNLVSCARKPGPHPTALHAPAYINISLHLLLISIKFELWLKITHQGARNSVTSELYRVVSTIAIAIPVHAFFVYRNLTRACGHSFIGHRKRICSGDSEGSHQHAYRLVIFVDRASR